MLLLVSFLSTIPSRVVPCQLTMCASLEFTEHQRQVFCVFSGGGVVELRKFLNNSEHFAHLRESTPTGHPRHAQNPLEYNYEAPHVAGHHHGGVDTGFDEQERDVIDDDDGLDDGSEMMIDGPPAQHDPAVGGASLDASMIPPPPPAPPQIPNHSYPWNHHGLHNQGVHNFPAIGGGSQPANQPFHSSSPLPNGVPFLGGQLAGLDGFATPTLSGQQSHFTDAMDATPTPPTASTAPTGSTQAAGPSTASIGVVGEGDSAGVRRAQQIPTRGNNREAHSSSSSPDTS